MGKKERRREKETKNKNKEEEKEEMKEEKVLESLKNYRRPSEEDMSSVGSRQKALIKTQVVLG